MTRPRDRRRREGQIVHPPPDNGPGGAPRRPGAADDPLKPGQTRKEVEGVFVIRDGQAIFTAVKTGIAGEKYFEVLDGLKEGDEVITGPFASVRTLKDGDAVKIHDGGAAPARKRGRCSSSSKRLRSRSRRSGPTSFDRS